MKYIQKFLKWCIRRKISKAVNFCQDARLDISLDSDDAYRYLEEAETLMRAARSLMR